MEGGSSPIDYFKTVMIGTGSGDRHKGTLGFLLESRFTDNVVLYLT